MITITDPSIESYLMKMTVDDDPFLAALEKRAAETGVPVVGPLVGRFLSLVSCLKQPRLVVELGSGFGYSAYWFARALGGSGKVVLTDYSREHMDFAERLFREAGLSDRVELRTGDALKSGGDYENIDILFIDLDKYLYPEAIRVMLPKLAANALVIADNALWHGTVAEEHPDHAESLAIRRFNEFMYGREEFVTTIVPLRDGILLAYRR